MIYRPEQKSRTERRFLASLSMFILERSTSSYMELWDTYPPVSRLRRVLDIHDEQNRVIPHSYRTQFSHSLDGVYEYNENMRNFGHTRISIRDSCM